MSKAAPYKVLCLVLFNFGLAPIFALKTLKSKTRAHLTLLDQLRTYFRLHVPMPHHRQKGFLSDPNGFPGDQALVAKFEEFAGSGETCCHSPQGGCLLCNDFSGFVQARSLARQAGHPTSWQRETKNLPSIHFNSVCQALLRLLPIFTSIHH